MPDLAPFTFPKGAAEELAQKAENRDYYSDLSDEEREAEGLPVREKPGNEDEKGQDRSASEEEGEQDEVGEEEEQEGESEESPDDTENLFAEIEGLQELSGLLGQEAPESNTEIDELIEAGLQHDDPIIRALAQKSVDLKKKTDGLVANAENLVVAHQLAKDAAEFDAVKKSYTIAGAPMTDAQISQVEKYIIDHPAVGRELTIEQLTRIVFPDAVKAGRQSRVAVGAEEKPGGKAARIIAEGGTGGAPAEPFQPRNNETIESAVEAAARRFGWKR
jgi:hypothetical protein